MSDGRVDFDESLGGGLQQAVTGVVAERVVDVLEVVEVEEQDCDTLARALRERQCVLDAVAEQAAVGEQGERVVEGELAQLLLERLALADVAEVEREAGDCRVVEQVAADGLERDCGASHCRPRPRPVRSSGRASHATSARNAASRSRSASAQRSSRLRPTRSSGFMPKVRSAAGDAKRRRPSTSAIMITSEAFLMSEA